MVDKLTLTDAEARRNAHVNNLYVNALKGSGRALEELSSIALGGYQPARDLVNIMDQALESTSIKPFMASAKT